MNSNTTTGYWADDGNYPIHYPDATSGRAAAQEYFDGFDDDPDDVIIDGYADDRQWTSDPGEVEVSVWRVALDEDGDECREDEDSYTFALPRHDRSDLADMALAAHYRDPCSHEWETPRDDPQFRGHRQHGGTTYSHTTVCYRCGCVACETDRGVQRNPGEGETAITVRLGEPEDTDD